MPSDILSMDLGSLFHHSTNVHALIFQARVWIEELLWDKKYGMDVYRCKGVLNIANSDQLHTLQVKHAVFL